MHAIDKEWTVISWEGHEHLCISMGEGTHNIFFLLNLNSELENLTDIT